MVCGTRRARTADIHQSREIQSAATAKIPRNMRLELIVLSGERAVRVAILMTIVPPIAGCHPVSAKKIALGRTHTMAKLKLW